MQVFAFEFVTGGGFLDGPVSPSLLREGNAMVTALAEDLTAAGVEVVALRSINLVNGHLGGARVYPVRTCKEFADEFARLAASSDWTIVTAPESSGHLLRLCRQVPVVGGRLFGPEPAVVELASNKQRTAEHLSAAGVPVPEGRAWTSGEPLPEDFSYPAVLKPRFGAGSVGVRLVQSPRESIEDGSAEGSWRLERFCPGLAASVAVLCGPGRRVALPACRQHLSDDGRFTYQGGSLPLPSPLASRAVGLADQAVGALPDCTGYVGVDLILGGSDNGREDVVVEVNPRLTTSYVGLRRATTANLAAAMLAIRQGGEPELSFCTEALQFDPDGSVALQPKDSI